MHLFYSFSCILRLYLAGIAFSELAFGTGIKNRYAVMAGAISYSFCFWALYTAPRHVFFLNPLIYFPLIILGIEKIIRKQRPYVLIASVAVSAASNFYFFYMIVVMAVIYALIRLGFLYRKNIKNVILALFRIAVIAVVGVCMAGIILLPVLMMFLQDSRMSVSQPFHLFYPLEYYSQLPSVIISTAVPYWLCIGFSVPVIIAVFILFIRRKENRFLKVLFVVCTIIILFPIGGRILNGMSYMANRWSWAFALLCSYILVKEWDNLISLPKSDWRKVLICCIAFYAVCLLFEESRSADTFSAITLLFISLLVVREGSQNKERMWKQQVLMILIVGISVINLSFWRYSPGEMNYVRSSENNSRIQEKLNNNETGIIKALSDEPYPRYTGWSVTKNANMLNQISSTQYYWTNSNPYMNRFRDDLEIGEELFYCYYGYDDRTALNALSAVQYYVTQNDTFIPYGYSLIDSIDAQNDLQQVYLDALKQELDTDELTDAQSAKIVDSLKNEYNIYKNQYALPLGYCYGSYANRETWESLDAVQKQELQLEAAYVNDAPIDGIIEYAGDISDYRVDFEIECNSDDIIETDNGFLTTDNNMKAVLTFEGMGNSETYICFEGLDFKAVYEYDLYSDNEAVDPLNLYNKTNWELLTSNQKIVARKAKVFWDYENLITITLKSSANISKTLNYRPPDAIFSSGRKDFIINLGYLEEPITSITISFPKRGIYTMDNLQVYNVPMDGYAEKIGVLQENTLQEIQLETDKISGVIDIDTPKLLCMAVPYSAGWKAFVDGEETPIMLTNERYLGISVPAGSHAIEFYYSMPYKNAGIVLSLAGIAALIITAALTERLRRTKNTSNHDNN